MENDDTIDTDDIRPKTFNPEDVLNSSALIEGLIVTDAGGKILFVNHAFMRETGYQFEELVGKTPNVLKSGAHDRPFYKLMWKSIFEHGFWEGEIWNKRKNGEVFPAWLRIERLQDEKGRTSRFVGVFSDALEYKHMDAGKHAQFLRDDVTGLMMRTTFIEQLDPVTDALPMYERVVAVLLIDVDRFKNINDSLGHDIGDLALRGLSNRLLKLGHEIKLVARMGGDELGLFVATTDYQSLLNLVDLTMERIRNRITVDGHELYLTGSVGVSWCQRRLKSSVELVDEAGTAMYKAKERGDDYEFYRSSMHKQAVERVAMETRLRKALENREFELHYQPQVDLHNGLVIGVEGLLRWRSPELGLVSPGEFIDLAEETGMIIPIGAWVLREAMTQQKKWFEAGKVLRVSVNVSGRQFYHEGFVELVSQLLQETAIPPYLLELEVVESVAMDNVDRAINTLNRLKALGVRISIDDFGTGYSSLSYLTQFDVDTLKIDQSFIRDLTTNKHSAAITKAIITLAQSLKLNVIAEGVETSQQLDFVLENDCDEMQGFLASRPVPAAELLDKIATIEHISFGYHPSSLLHARKKHRIFAMSPMW